MIGLILVVVVLALAGIFVYNMGKRLGWWIPKPGRTPLSPTGDGKSRPGAHDDLPPAYALVSDIWMEARIREHDVWYYVARNKWMLRIHIVSTKGGDKLYVEVVGEDDYIARTSGTTHVQLYEFGMGSKAAALVRTVRAKAGGPDEYVLEHAQDVAEGTPATPPTDDALRRLKTALQLADKF